MLTQSWHCRVCRVLLHLLFCGRFQSIIPCMGTHPLYRTHRSRDWLESFKFRHDQSWLYGVSQQDILPRFLKRPMTLTEWIEPCSYFSSLARTLSKLHRLGVSVFFQCAVAEDAFQSRKNIVALGRPGSKSMSSRDRRGVSKFRAIFRKGKQRSPFCPQMFQTTYLQICNDYKCIALNWHRAILQKGEGR